MLKDKFAPVIEANFPQKTKELEKKIALYVDRNSEILLSMDLSRRYSFGDNDRQILYDALGISLDDLTKAIAESKEVYSGNKVQSQPFYVASLLAAWYCLGKRNENMATTVLTYMSLMMYTSLHKGFFQYGANKAVMDYTLAHLGSAFSIRNFPSLFAFIQDNAKTVLTTYRNRIASCTDKDITWVIDATWTRLKQKIRKISNAFYENHKSGNYLNADQDSYSKDDYHEMDNASFAIDRLTTKVYTKLINRQYDRRFIKYSITNSDMSLKKVENLIEDIIDADAETHTMRDIISAMIEFYTQQSGKPFEYLAKGDFIAYMKSAYSSNTEVAQMGFIKRTIDSWLDQNMYKYGKANYGKTMRIAYRRCIYMFFVFVINYNAKM